MQRTRDLNDRQLYYRLRGIAQHTIKTAEQQYWRDYCSTLDGSSKMSEVWATVKKMSSAQSRSSIPTIIHGGVVYDSNQEKAELFAKKIAAVSSDENLSANFQDRRDEFERQIKEPKSQTDERKECKKTPNSAQPYGQCNSMNVPFEIHELTDVLRNCKSKSAPADDRISYVMLKQIPRSCQATLLKLFNEVWLQGQLPSDWKKATIIPLLKAKKSAFDVASYRPVAVISTLCKIMERMVANRLRWWMESNHYFNKSQSGFRKQRSTIDQIMRLADAAHKAVNNRRYTVAVMLDLEKAFDLVWHDGLLYKMEKMGLNGNILNFMTDFLANRSIRVRVGIAMSNSYQLQNGTPQGSVISPLLFLIIPSNGVRLSLYADDSATWKYGPNHGCTMIKDIQRFLDRLTEFFDRWGFKLSLATTGAIVFTRNRKFRPDDVKLTFGGSLIKVEKTVRFLGIVFDRTMNGGSRCSTMQ